MTDFMYPTNLVTTLLLTFDIFKSIFDCVNAIIAFLLNKKTTSVGLPRGDWQPLPRRIKA